MFDSERTSFAHNLPRAAVIAQLNDALRKTATGGHIFVTSGVKAIADYDPQALLDRLAAYDAFDEYNDPHGEHDFGDLTLGNIDLLWKIDYFDLDLRFASPDPADPDVTVRVLTIMLESEY